MCSQMPKHSSMMYESLTRYSDIFDSLLTFAKPNEASMLQQETQNLTGLQYILAKQQELKKAEAEANKVKETLGTLGRPIFPHMT